MGHKQEKEQEEHDGDDDDLLVFTTGDKATDYLE